MDQRETNEQDANKTPGEALGRAPSELASIWSWRQTARLTLRRLLPTDGPAMFAVHGDPATNLYNPFGPHPDLATSEEMVGECLQHWEASGFGLWAVTYVQEEQIIGFGGVEHRIWREREVLNLYYRLTLSAWGQDRFKGTTMQIQRYDICRREALLRQVGKKQLVDHASFGEADPTLLAGRRMNRHHDPEV